MKGCCLAAIKGGLLALYLACASCGVHASGEDGAEAAFVYSVDAGTNSFVAVTPEDFTETLAFMVVPTASADEEGLEAAEEVIEDPWHEYKDSHEAPTVVAAGEGIVPSATTVYQIALEGTPFALVPVDVTTAGAYALFLEHGEVETGLVSPEGVVLTAAFSEGADDDEEEESNMASGLTGIILVVSKYVSGNIDLSSAFALAAGALLAASFLHIIPEAMEGLAGDEIDLHQMGIDAGISILVGLFVSICIRAVLETREHGGVNSGNKISAEGDNHAVVGLAGDDSLSDLIVARKGRSLFDFKGLRPVCWNVLIGDFVHNFADGIVIGGAFLGCGNVLGWTVTASTIAHEIPHEIADFLALVNGGMSVMQAFAFNLMSAMSAVLGVIIILALSDSLSNAQVSVIVLLGAGSFVYIGMVELLPAALGARNNGDKRAVQWAAFKKLFAFIVGAVLIGGPLVFDKHCEADGHHHHDH
eukprot:g10869.t1